MPLKQTQNLFLGAVLAIFSILSGTSHAAESNKIISEQEAMQAALAEVGGEIIGIRFDKPDTQWDVFVKSGNQGYEVEVDAISGKIIATEPESLAEIQAELSGNLTHEGIDGDVDK